MADHPLLALADLQSMAAADAEPPTTTKTGPGKKSADELIKEDAYFQKTICGEFLQVVDLRNMPSQNEDEFVKFCKGKARDTAGVKAKIQSKLGQVKRRKNNSDTDCLATLEALQHTSQVFAAIYSDLAAVHCNAADLDGNMIKAEMARYDFGMAAQLKRCKLLCMECAKFGKYDDMASLLSVSGTLAEVLQSEAAVDAIFMQICNRMLQALPNGASGKVLMESPAAANFRRMIDACYNIADTLAISTTMQQQLVSARIAISIGDTATLPADGERAVDVIENGMAATHPLYASLTSLPEASTLLGLCKAFWVRKSGGSETLTKIGEIRSRLVNAELETTPIDTAALAQDLRAFEHLQGAIDGKEEETHMQNLQHSLASTLKRVFQTHIQDELVPHAQSLVVHVNAKLKCADPPEWGIMKFEQHSGCKQGWASG